MKVKKQLMRTILFCCSLSIILMVSCSDDYALSNEVVDESRQVYAMYLNVNPPSYDMQQTRALNNWGKGDNIHFRFYYNWKNASDGLYEPMAESGYLAATYGIATYDEVTGRWVLETKGNVLPDPDQWNVCDAWYAIYHDSDSTDLLTEYYYGESTWSFTDDKSVKVDMRLFPVSWRLRFKGAVGAQVVFDSGNRAEESHIFPPNVKDKLYFMYPFDPNVNGHHNLKLKVQSDGYTPYVYGCWKGSGERTIYLENGNHEFMRTIDSEYLGIGESGVLTVPTIDNYEQELWTLVAISETSASPTSLDFEPTADSKYITVTSNEQWTATSDATSWCTVSPASGSNGGKVKVAVTANTSTSQRTAHVTVTGKTSGDVTSVIVTQAGKLEDADVRTFTVTGNGKTVTFKMVRVEHGTFQMGATAEQGSDAYSDEKPVHSVTLTNDYFMGETEVTQALWYAVMGQKPTASGSQWSGTYGLGDQRPAYYVSWNDCQEFITKLNTLTGQTFRLPTEAEWEFAARGGNKSKGYKYAGSDNIGDVAWYSGNSNSSTHDVATKQANELGLYDMSGNVWEWCSDKYGSYGSSAQTNPTGSTTTVSIRVLRGGCWDIYAGGCRVSYRSNGGAGLRRDILGLRLALQ